jgi:hypothetical protein
MDPLQTTSMAPTGGFDNPAPAPAIPMGAPAVPATPMAAPVPVTMAAGGSTGKPFGGFFEGITLVDIGMLALVSLAMFYSIYASRQAIAYYSNLSNQTKQDIANLKASVQNIQSVPAAPAVAVPSSSFV